MTWLALLASLMVTASQAVSSERGDQHARLTLEQAKRIVRDQGPRKAVETSLEGKWTQLLEAIATGEPGWLDMAIQLGAHSDAEASESLSAAMGEALRRAPREVLLRLDGKPFSPSGVCGNSFADLAIQGATDAEAGLASQEAAVAKVRDPKLKQRRDVCLKQIRSQERR
jgi:hypothetical protein